jgi:hypothetical protein
MRRLILLTLITLLGTLVVVGAADARALRAPAPTSPANGARAQQLPAISWNAVRGAASYEYQVAADSRFNSIALGRGPGKGTNRTYNLSATLDKAVPNGTYYWRVRGLTAKGKVGKWSRTRRIVKSWSTAPQIVGGNGAAVSWPTNALVLRWSSVPYANKYIVSVATDPGLSNLVLGTRTKPVETQGVNFAMPISLAPGPYYWAITPVDAEGHRGVRSAVATFQWNWPTTTATSITDLNPEAGIFADPMFSWNPIAGAARYEVEVNSSADFAPGSKWCCSGTTTGTSLAPIQGLANNRYYWRVRALDARGDAGAWNNGQPFEKSFDPSTPTVRNLTVRNADGQALTGFPSTDTPIVTWDPVPGASLYEVQLGFYDGGLGCDFSHSSAVDTLHATTATTAWTPLAQNLAGKQGPSAWPTPQHANGILAAGETAYCVRVLARTNEDAQNNQVISAWTQINGANQPAFRFADVSAETEETNKKEEQEEEQGKRPSCPATRRPTTERGVWSSATAYTKNDVVEEGKDGPSYLSLVAGNAGHVPASSPDFWSPLTLATPACAYRLPATGTTTALTPLLTWKRVTAARGYYVVIARDARFTEVADVGFTNVPAYAPRLANEAPLSDETTDYYWAVIPTAEASGHGVFSFPCFTTSTNPCESSNDSPQRFEKSSSPPQPESPAAGASISAQPTFHWSLADNARTYQLQVASDPSFGKPIDDVTTVATAYTSVSTYPADTVLYWRVRANDWDRQGLNWSPTQTFVRRLPVPALDPLGATTVLGIPPITWSPVQGAIGYDMHVEQPTGQVNDFSLDSPSATITTYYGTGIVHYQVRAEFPTTVGGGKVAGAYSPRQASLLILAAPRGVRGIRSGSRLLVTWRPEPDAKQYEVEISATNGFLSRIESHKVDGTSWAPNIDLSKKSNRGTLYWRVAPVDQHGGIGSFTSGAFAGGQRRPRCVAAKHRVRHTRCKKR